MPPSSIALVLCVATSLILGAPVIASNITSWHPSHISPGVGDVTGRRASTTSGFHHFNAYRASRARFFSQEAFPNCVIRACSIQGLGDFFPEKKATQRWRKHVGATTGTAVGVSSFVGTKRASAYDENLILRKKVHSAYLHPLHVTTFTEASRKSPLVYSASGSEDTRPSFDSSSSLRYFAYGANMSPAILTQKRGVRPRVSVPAEAVSVLDTQLANRTTNTSGSCRTSHQESGAGVCLCFSHRSGT